MPLACTRRLATTAIKLAWLAALPSLAAQAPQLVEVHRMVPTVRNFIRHAAVGDLDGDGLRDLVLLARDRASTWRAAGNGRFVTMQMATGLPPEATDVALADLDGDGDRDCVVANAANCDTGSPACGGGADFVLWNNAGQLTSVGPVLPADPAVISRAVAAGDVDGDGDIDLVFGCVPHVWAIYNFPLPPIFTREHGENWLFLNNGSGQFTAANARLGLARDSTSAIVLEDFDGDGDLDLFAGNAATIGFGGAQDAYYQNDGNGNFTRLPAALPVDTDDAVAAFGIDIDNDGDRDLLVHTHVGVRLLRNNGSGVFTDISANVPAVTNPVEQVFAGDWDGDGDVDLGVRNGRLLFQLRNNGSGVFTHLPSADRSGDMAFALPLDVDGDGDVDLVLPFGGFWESSLLQNDGTGAWQAVPRELPDSQANQLQAVAVDLDRDGDLDVLAPATESTPDSVYRNDGSGRFAAAAYGNFTTDLAETMSVAAGDLDGDGYPDAVLANTAPFSPGPPSQIYRNNGAGRLDRVATPTVDAWSVAVGDLDSDGDLDIYFGTSGADVVLQNLGNMVFAPIAGAVANVGPTVSVALVDIDGDGDLDAVLAGWFGAANRVLQNDGTGAFTFVPNALPNHLEDSQCVTAADVDGDGDQDLIIANDGGGTPEPNRLYRNNGLGVFTDSSQDLPPGNGRTISHTAADFDGDGDLDLIECSFHGPLPTRLLANDGLGHFTVVPDGLPEVSDYAHRFVAGDFDRDGDLDAFLVSQAPPNVYWNLRRHIVWRELPRIGRPLNLDVYGAPGEPFGLGAGTLRFDPPIAILGLGLLHVDTTTLIRTEIGALDLQGHAARTFAVPSNAILLGVPFYWQALIGNAAQLSNLEITELRRP